MASRLSQYFGLTLAVLWIAGCGSGTNAVDTTQPEPPPSATVSQLQQAVDAAIATPGSGGSVATSILESSGGLAEENPGKEKTIAEIQSLANNVMSKEASGENPTPDLKRIKTLLGQLK